MYVKLSIELLDMGAQRVLGNSQRLGNARTPVACGK